MIDILIISIIAFIVLYYVYLRYKEEKRKEKENYIPNLLKLKEKFIKEKEEFGKKVEELEQKLKEAEEEYHKLKENFRNFKWNDFEKERLKNLKETEFIWYFTNMFELLGFKVLEPKNYKENNIDIILRVEHIDKEPEYIIVDFVDFTDTKNIDENYLKALSEGKEKYKINKVWIITNGNLTEKQKKMISDYDFNLFEYNNLITFFPSLDFVDKFYENRTKYHNFAILHQETKDEITRRDIWLSELEEKLKKAT